MKAKPIDALVTICLADGAPSRLTASAMAISGRKYVVAKKTLDSRAALLSDGYDIEDMRVVLRAFNKSQAKPLLIVERRRAQTTTS